MNNSKLVSWLIALFVIVGVGAGSVPAQAATADAASVVIHSGTSYQNDTSLPLYYLPAWSGDAGEEHEGPENPRVPIHHVDSEDPVVQNAPARAPRMPAPNLNFDGIVFPGVGCNCAPPDPNGEVGETQYVQMVNEGFQVFDKSTGNSILGPQSISSLWSGFGGVCETGGAGDPIVLYDQLANRWVISQFAGGNTITDECIAVSTSSDAAGSYNRYGFHLGSNFFDYPHLGMWPDGYYMSMNVFNAAGTAYLGPQPFAFDRAAMIAGQAGATFVTTSVLGSSHAPILPADLDGSSSPPIGAPNPFVEFPDTTYQVYKFHADFATPANSTFTLLNAAPAAGYSVLCGTTRSCVPQLNGSGNNKLDGIADRLMFRLAYRNFGDHESLVGNYTVKSNNVAGVRWFELRNVTGGPATVYQESTYQPDSDWRWLGSAAMDHMGNLAVGFSASNTTINPQLRYAGRLATDPLNSLAQGEAHLYDGAGAQTGTGNRWGDYSDLTVDPVDDCTFWYTNEYYATTGQYNWRTRIGSFKFDGCTTTVVTHVVTPSVGTPSGTIAPSTAVTVNDGATTAFTLTPASGFQIASVAGTCGGTLAGSTYTTNAVTADCTVIANFSATGGGGVAGTFPTDENFDEQTVPALPTDWPTAASGGGIAWVTENTIADSAPNAAFAPDIASVSDMTLDTPTFTPVAGQTLTFRHKYNLETSSGGPTEFDGAVLEISINSGAFEDIVGAGGSFISGGYTGTISSSFMSPIAGRMAWSGDSGGFVDVVVNLPAAAAGQPTALRFRTADDSSGTANGTSGWWIDTIHLGAGSGVTHVVTPSVGTPSGTISPSTPVTVNDGATTTFALTPDSGFQVASVAGTCGGTLAGDTYTTNAVTANCTVIANFATSGGVGIPGTFPTDENFDEQVAPLLPTDWPTAASGDGIAWVTDNTVADSAPNSAFAPDIGSVSDMSLDTPTFTPAAGQTLSFRHQYNLEIGTGTTAFDGAVLEISINGAAFADIIDAGGSFISGGYNSTVSSSFTSPIAGRMAWSGDSGGFVDAAVNLPTAATGQPTVLRFRTADDSSSTASDPSGWWVDTIHLGIASVVTHVVTPSVGTPSGTISPSTPVTVNDGATTTFTLTPNSGFQIASVGGTCGGLLSGNVYTTSAVTADCTVIANFADVTQNYTVGGTVNGLSGTGLKLALNGTETLPVAINGGFTFTSMLADGSAYSVTIATQPTGPDQVCTVANGSGTIAGANVTNVVVTCAADDTIFKDGFDGTQP